MIKKLLKLNTKHFRVSLFYYSGNFFLSFFRYLFHLLLLRLLSPNDYGEFLTYLSLMYLLAIPTGTIANIITKVVSDFNGRKDKVSINAFFHLISKKTINFALITGLFLIVFAEPLSVLFKAHPIAFVVLGVGTVFSLFQTIIGSYLSGLQKFVLQTTLGFVNVTLTILLAVVFINLGLGPVGGIIGQISAGLITTLIATLYIKNLIFPKVDKTLSYNINLKEYANLSLVNALGVMSLMSVDILMVRVFFPEHLSGIYSSMSVLGRMIVYGLAPLTALVLPVASKRYSEGNSHLTVFYKLGSVVLGLGILAYAAFSLFPETITRILSGNNFAESARLLPTFALAMVLFSFSQFILAYLMGTGRQNSNYFLLAVTALQPLFIYFNRHSISGVVNSNLGLQIALFVALTLFLFKKAATKVKFKHGQG